MNLSESPSPQKLLEPVQLGPYRLRNRIVMSPMTRNRSPAEIPSALNAEYYAQRASAGLVICESTAISREGLGWPNSPGIFNDAQVRGWRGVTDAVHARDGVVFLQLWHCGRCSHPSTRFGEPPLAPSALVSQGTVRTPAGRVPLTVPRAMGEADIARTLADYRRAAQRAMDAGFDGVEVHGANGYLIDQFLRESANQRQDGWGGTVEGRCRLLLEAVATVCEVWGPQRVGARLSPTSPTPYFMHDSDPASLLATALEGLDRFQLAYVAVVEGSSGPVAPTHELDYPAFKHLFKGLYVANNGYTQQRGEAALRAGRADLISFGRPYIANPDLARRFALNASLNTLNPDTVYLTDARGYTDYPTL